MILNEIIEEAKRNKAKRVVFKVDFAKAYDSIDWNFLDDLLRRFKFPERWRKWIGVCLSSATANVLVNGSPSGEFRLGRGVRQGDPLSPFLFLVVAEGLSLLVRRAVDVGLLRPVEVGRDKIRVSHIQYADDTIFTAEGSQENVMAIKWLLKNFEALSGLSVNFGKSCVFGINIDHGVITGLWEIWLKIWDARRASSRCRTWE